MRHVEQELSREGVEYLQVKTLGPSRPNAEYALTKKCYERVGFVPLEELSGMWPGVPCLSLVKHIDLDPRQTGAEYGLL